MLMMFGAALRKAPFERAMPFNEKDLMILINQEYGFRLCNITKETGETFEIGSFIVQNPDVFGKQTYTERVKEFAEIFSGRVERFFETKKNDYIFFDLEEQKFIRKLMSKAGLSCSIELYKYDKNQSPKKIDILDLNLKDGQMITKFLAACKVRHVENCRDYFYKNQKNKKTNSSDRFKQYSERKKQEEEKKNKFFYKYPKLKELDTKERVNLYFKKLTVKYHPDRENGDPELCAEIRGDFEIIKETSWYINLKDRGDI